MQNKIIHKFCSIIIHKGLSTLMEIQFQNVRVDFFERLKTLQSTLETLNKRYHIEAFILDYLSVKF